MNPLPAPSVPGNTEWERFDNAVKKVFSVPVEAVQKERRAKMRGTRRNRRRISLDSSAEASKTHFHSLGNCWGEL